MNDNNKAISALAMDLKRVALGYHNGSIKTADRFMKEVLIRKDEINLSKVKPYLKAHLKKLSKLTNQKDKEKLAEDALMYSTIFQNYVIHNLS